ncbi:hypothetical protein M501DRAFT_1010693 [Patellaria atrata CBS 101060]|uniref:CENP-Q, a CENPA-CAD centromere complex subunit-domain-containing protein n=1 Tax=Patellaria atrata CBS 101060 TaxID=1346257 RepID=A0A9P4VS85_9PEZI|nr:hypothetical protein M501DRAFT_1010693 [Patellaria atrata CBS 101060]
MMRTKTNWEETRRGQHKRNLVSHQDPKTKTREKRKRVEDDDHAPVVLVERPAKKFKQLTTRTRYISQDTMAEKWRPLPQAVQHQIREIFRAAKRQIILGKRDDRRRAEAEVVLASVVKRLDKMLPKMAVPQKTLEMHFNLDKLIERNVALDSQLTPAMHSVELLKSQIKEQEQLLNIDRQCLKRLKDDAREEELRQRSTTRGVHPAIKLPVDFEKGDDDPESISLVLSTPFADQVLEDEISYPELQSLLGQLRNHLESMQANMAQVDGIGDALISAHASLDGLLHTHASAAQYDQLTKV